MNEKQNPPWAKPLWRRAPLRCHADPALDLLGTWAMHSATRNARDAYGDPVKADVALNRDLGLTCSCRLYSLSPGSDSCSVEVDLCKPPRRWSPDPYCLESTQELLYVDGGIPQHLQCL